MASHRITELPEFAAKRIPDLFLAKPRYLMEVVAGAEALG
jgi:hypothetical protein